jgi:hypothetical protein
MIWVARVFDVVGPPVPGGKLFAAVDVRARDCQQLKAERLPDTVSGVPPGSEITCHCLIMYSTTKT